jgi:hypothetical protein
MEALGVLRDSSAYMEDTVNGDYDKQPAQHLDFPQVGGRLCVCVGVEVLPITEKRVPQEGLVTKSDKTRQ